MPPEDRVRSDEEDRPAVAAEHTSERAQDGAVVGFEARTRDLTSQHRELMAQDENLDILGTIPSTAQHPQGRRSQTGAIRSHAVRSRLLGRVFFTPDEGGAWRIPGRKLGVGANREARFGETSLRWLSVGGFSAGAWRLAASKRPCTARWRVFRLRESLGVAVGGGGARARSP
jgi:hypothetical protein